MTRIEPRELLIHELEDMLCAEHIIFKMLPERAKEAQHSEIREALKEHERETYNLLYRQTAHASENSCGSGVVLPHTRHRPCESTPQMAR